jgi:tetratricopeptide (TPR) repeat protein
LRIQPDFPCALSNLGFALNELERPAEAEVCCRQALRLLPGMDEAFNNLGNALSCQGKVPDAIAAYCEALRLNPSRAEAHHNLGNAYLEAGHFDWAQTQFAMALKLNPRDVKTYHSLSLMRRFSPAEQHTAAEWESVLDRGDLPAVQRSYLHYAIGKIYDDGGQYERAFPHFRRANQLIRPDFDRSGHAAFVDRLIRDFPRSTFAAGAGSGNDSPLPVFIVGMFRSGTSLVEQILGSHGQVHGCGELADVKEIAARWWRKGDKSNLCEASFGPPGKLDLSPFPPRAELAELAEAYLARRSAVCGSARRVTDKMPTNFFYLGMIALLLPKARIIHCRRDPLDTCLSCYFTNFRNRPAHACDLEDLGIYYRHYQRLMEHWQGVLPLEILEVRYEDLVEDLPAQTRRLLDFCGLPWDERCLRYYENQRPVQTSSVWQVRQPIYTTSIGRWRHYEKYLQPLLDALESPVAEHAA